MAIYKRGRVYWYQFVLNNQRVQCSTKQGNPRVARQIEAAHKTRLAKGEVGIEAPKKVPTLQEFGPRFKAEIKVHCAGKPRTIAFWQQKLKLLLEFTPMASAPLDKINKALIANYVQSRHGKVAVAGKKLGYLFVREGKSKNARRHVSLTSRAQEMLVNRSLGSKSEYVFANYAGKPYLVTSLDHLHKKLRGDLQLPKDCVIHSLRHTFLTRFGEAGADAFTIKKAAGHSSVTISRTLHSPDAGRPGTRLRAFR